MDCPASRKRRSYHHNSADRDDTENDASKPHTEEECGDCFKGQEDEQPQEEIPIIDISSISLIHAEVGNKKFKVRSRKLFE